MAVKYGEFNSAQLKPTWEDTSKPGKDSTGWKRGGRSWEDGESFFMKSADPAFDDVAYGRRGDRPNGQQVVQTKNRFPSDLADHFKGSKGVDTGEPDHGDDRVTK
jgi:hypothetical protein